MYNDRGKPALALAHRTEAWHKPTTRVRAGWQAIAAKRLAEILKRAIKGEFVILVSAFETLQEQPPKQTREHVDG